MSISPDANKPASDQALFDVERIRRDFPLLTATVHGRPLVYFDNAATSQKPSVVIEAERHYYQTENANVHRGVHALSERATAEYEEVRRLVARFLNAESEREIIFVRGATEAINLVASSFGRMAVKAGDEILVTAMEHHSNIVPWQLLCGEKGATLRVVPMNDAGEVLLDEYERLLTPKTRLVALAHVSNALGTVNPVRRMIEAAHRSGIPVLLDGAQAVPHLRVDVRELDCDFYVLSSHKLFGPTGVGVLYGRERLLDAMPPYQGGGDMIRSVTFEKTTFNELPYKFEAGTPNIAGTIAFGEAIRYVSALPWPAVMAHEDALLREATIALGTINGTRIIGTAAEKVGVLSFLMDGIHPHDIGTILDQYGVAVRTGHHCAQPVMDRYGIPATARASFAFYNTREEISVFADALKRVKEVFG